MEFEQKGFGVLGGRENGFVEQLVFVLVDDWILDCLLLEVVTFVFAEVVNLAH